MPVPDHQRHDVVTIDAPITRRPPPPPGIVRSTGPGALDIDQLAAVLARLLEL
jgi:hypothetical protein